MATLAKLAVELSLTDKFSQGLKNTKENLDKWGDSLRSTGQKFTLGLTTPIVAGFGLMIKSASDLNEATSATQTVFKNTSSDIIDFSNTTADAYGITKQGALEAITTLGQLAMGVGLTEDAARDMGISMVSAAGDLASFRNADPSDVLADIQSGLVGQYEPLLKYGIVLNEATVAQKAMEMSGKSSADQLTNAEKVLARSTLITEGLGAAQGDAARTADSLANVIRRLRARGKDLAAKWGQLLLPNVLKFSQFLIKVTAAIEGLSPKMQKLIMIGLALAAAIGPILIALGMMLPAISVLLGPVGLIIIAIGLLGAAFATDFMGIRGIVMDVVDALGTLSRYFMRAFSSGESVKALTAALPEPLQKVGRAFFLVADAVGDLVAAFKKNGFSGLLDALPGELGQVWEALKILASEGFGKLKEAFLGIPWAQIGLDVLALGKTAFAAIPWGDIWSGITGFFSGLWDTFQNYDYNQLGVVVGQGIRTAIETVGPTLLTVGGKLIRSLYDGLTGADWQEILKWVALIPVAIPLAIVGAATVLLPKGKEFMEGMMEGLGINWEVIKGWLKNRAINAALAVGSLIKTLYQHGKDLLQGMADGADFVWQVTKTWLSNRALNAQLAIGGLLKTLYTHGQALLQGLYDGAFAVWLTISGWLGSRDGAAVSAIGDMSGALWSAGWSLMEGFWSGISAGWEWVKGMLGTLDPSKYKGPPARDAKMLIENGKLIMGGLSKGLASGWSDVTKQLGGYSSEMSGSYIGGLSGGSSGGTTANYGGITINVTGGNNPQATADAVFSKFVREMALTTGGV